MKICTYNIWDDTTRSDIRLKLLVKEINKHNIDLLALQEVRDKETFDLIKEQTGFTFGHYYEGLGILSKFDIQLINTHASDNNFLMRVTYEDTSFTNVHLDWKEESNRMNGIHQYFKWLDEFILYDEFLLGDFNSIPESKIHFELLVVEFEDLHREYCHNINEIPLPTLDMVNNPRWRGENTDEEPYRFDWVMLNTEGKYSIKKAGLIGTEEEDGIAPSDHYAVLIDIDFN